MYVRIHIYIYARTVAVVHYQRVLTSWPLFIYMYAHVYILVYIYTYIHPNIQTCMNIYIFTYIHIMYIYMFHVI